MNPTRNNKYDIQGNRLIYNHTYQPKQDGDTDAIEAAKARRLKRANKRLSRQHQVYDRNT